VQSDILNAMSSVVSDHFDGKRFFNPHVDTDKSFADMRRWRREARAVPWPARVANEAFPPPPARAPDGAIAATLIGHATFLLQLAGLNILTDPVFSERASPVQWAGPRRVRDPGVALDHLPPIDLVLLSHNHYDHMDLPSLRAITTRWRPPIVTGLGNGRYLARKGIGGAVELDWWQSTTPRAGVSVTYVPAQHWSKRGFFDRRKMLWGGHVIAAPAGRIYFAGDTGYPGHFAEIARRLGRPDLALLPIGAYEPRWFMGAQHMNPDDAVRAHLDLGARLSLAMHFATFHLTDEAIDEPVRALGVALGERGVAADAFRVPRFGEVMMLPAESDQLEAVSPSPSFG
jgi:L-ascorbate metabolism protein UlaG (beta-lactamase superfamily)